MAYDSPKAAHFDAFDEGRKLPWNDRIGVAARWQVAHVIHDILGIANMLSLTTEQRERIQTYLASASPFPGVRVTLDERYIANLS